MRRRGKCSNSANINNLAGIADINYCADCNGVRTEHPCFFLNQRHRLNLGRLCRAHKLILLLAILSPCLLFLVGGCTGPREYVHNGFKVGPNYAPAQAPVADDWIDKRKDGEELTRWWTVFNDPILDELVCTAYKQNLTLRQAADRILEARATLGIAVGNIFPQSQFNSGSFTTTELSKATVNGSAFRTQSTFGQWNYGFGLAWEVDFWGLYRRTVESADASLDASVADYDDVLVMLLSNVASTYVQMRTTEKRVEYAQSKRRPSRTKP